MFNISDALIEFLYPKIFKCVLCHYRGYSLLSSGLCRICEERLPFTEDEENSLYNYSVFYYKDALPELIYRYKYKAEKDLSLTFGYYMYEAMVSKDIDIDLIIPVPLHTNREKERGFNQAKLLTDYLSDKLNLDYMPEGLIRIKDTPQQAKLTKRERERNLIDAFEINPKCLKGIKDKKILLVDDVYTTGSTSKSCESVLSDSGAKSVYLFTLAKSKQKETIE